MIITIDDLTLPSGQHEVNNIKYYGFSGRTVQYKLAFYDKAGDLMHIEDQWLASITNIPANSDWPFETTISVPGFSTYTVTPIDVRAWRPR